MSCCDYKFYGTDNTAVFGSRSYIVYLCPDCKRLYIKMGNDKASEVTVECNTGVWTLTGSSIPHKWHPEQEAFDESIVPRKTIKKAINVVSHMLCNLKLAKQMGIIPSVFSEDHELDCEKIAEMLNGMLSNTIKG